MTTLLCYGDSLTLGNALPDPTTCWTVTVGTATGRTVDNRAVNGSLMAAHRATILAAAVPTSVELVVWITGYVDMRLYAQDASQERAYFDRLHECIDYLTRDGARLVLGNCIKALDYTGFAPYNVGSDAAGADYATLAAAAATIWLAKGREVFVADCRTALSTSNFLPDGAHPNATGNAQIAAVFLPLCTPVALDRSPD